MSELNFYWKCVLKTGQEINQFDNNRDDNFKRVKDNFDNIEYFSLYHKDHPKEVNFIVDVIQGFIYIGQYNPILDRFKKEKNNIRLIYGRNNEIDFALDGKKLAHRIIYMLGYQYNSKDGSNHKVILQIGNNGEFSIVD